MNFSKGYTVRPRTEGNSPILPPVATRINPLERPTQPMTTPQAAIPEEDPSQYSHETINEMIKLKIEQEKTKQETIKNESVRAAVELLKLAQTLKIDTALIPYLFQDNISEHFNGIAARLRNDPKKVIKEIEQVHKDIQRETKRGKRAWSDVGLSSQGYQQVPSSLLYTSTQITPKKSAVVPPRRASAEAIEKIQRASNGAGSRLSLPSINPKDSTQQQQTGLTQPFIPQFHPTQQLSPPSIPSDSRPLHVFPVYFTPQSVPSLSPIQANGQTEKNLGSPYQQKYWTPPALQLQPQAYHRYTAIIPSPSSAQSNQQYVSTHMPQQQVIQATQLEKSKTKKIPASSTNVPAHHFQNTGVIIRNSFRPVEAEEVINTNKRVKSNRNSNINFMITTPKNPPARKYNNPNKLK
ncbi:uncharacterized protein J8A68_000615 [[Candida] subhashii]|uniref:Uncharacterized protein n=1 Tax=[Candida] subhashii TaxID=561895 RepID=A0A8J5QV72_9ASCO|nr:uncharacterized protein J8A68_000615 [[Candida] subhashii]KAG7665790.1 hypothetical protein J8A68_000615 [[Candida] subhashii]